MPSDRSNQVLESIIDKIDLPDSAYEKADGRYKDIGDWLHRPESTCLEYAPHVFSQGSFRLGTAIRPDTGDKYDLDIGCKLRDGLSKEAITQEWLKTHVGKELELYRRARGIKEDLIEKRRCWRLEYADGLSFHMDIVPCIPETDTRRHHLKKRMMEATSLNENLAQDVSALAVSITDNADDGYKNTTDDWRTSNPEGYARWFQSRMKTARTLITEREATFKASIDSLPYYKWKTPLQRSIQLLKRHRDTMYKNKDDAKPISAIITTLAARAYEGETELVSTLDGILSRMDNLVNIAAPHVPNPVNPDEDFADKWYSKDHQHLGLRHNFYMWLTQAKADFTALCSKSDSQLIVEASERGFAVPLNKAQVERALGLSPTVITPVKRIEVSDPKPWYGI